MSTSTPTERLNVGDTFTPWHNRCGFFPQDEVNRMPHLSTGAKLVYWVLVRFAGRDGRCFPSRKRIAADVALSVRQVDRYLSELRGAGLLRHERGRTGRSNRYEFVYHEAFRSLGKAAKRTRENQEGVSGQEAGFDSPKESYTSTEAGQIRRPNDKDNYSYNKHSENNSDRLQVRDSRIGEKSKDQLLDEVLFLIESIADMFPDSRLLDDQMGEHFHEALLKRLDGYSPAEFAQFVNKRFSNGQSPDDPDGPRKWAFLLQWAVDFSREKKGDPPLKWDPDWQREEGRITMADLRIGPKPMKPARLTPPPSVRAEYVDDDEPF